MSSAGGTWAGRLVANRAEVTKTSFLIIVFPMLLRGKSSMGNFSISNHGKREVGIVEDADPINVMMKLKFKLTKKSRARYGPG
jgi:hypothetical protein